MTEPADVTDVNQASAGAEPTPLVEGLAVVAKMSALARGTLSIGVVGALIFALGTVLSTVILGRITDDVIAPTFTTGEVPDGSLLWAPVAVMSITLIRLAGVIGRRYFAGMAAERVQRHYRRELANRFIRLPLAWHQQIPTGQLLAHADNDTDVATEVMHPMPFSLGAVFMAIFATISLLLTDWILALVALAIFPLLALLNRVYSSRIEAPAAAVQASVGEVSSIAHESFEGALVVKLLGRENDEDRRFSSAAHVLRDRRIQIGYLRAVFESAMDVLPNLGIVIVIIVGAFRVEAGAVSVGDLVQVAALFNVLAFPMRVFGFFLESLPPSVVANARLQRVFHEVPPTPRPNRNVLADAPIGISAEHVGFTYPDGTEVLRDVSLTIAPGEVVAMVGPTGAGKSTLVSVLAGLVPPSEGLVTLGGHPIDDVSEEERTSALALVFQESFMFADTLRANIDLSNSLSEAQLVSIVQLARVDLFLDDLPHGLDTVVGERGVTLSGGQRQRVALARALAQRPRFLILDDATSAVDAEVEQQILHGLEDHLSTTTLIVAQRVSTIELAERVVFVQDGRVEGVGTHDELMNLPGYEALVTAYAEAAR